jgi:hypothetical protein
MPLTTSRAERFRYEGYSIDPAQGTVACNYSTNGHAFTERYRFSPDGDWTNPALDAAVRILYLLAGVSYYKTTAAHGIDLGTTATTAEERGILQRYYREGLGEFAFRNGLDLDGVTMTGPDDRDPPTTEYRPEPGRPLIPFGGGIDSVVTVSLLGAAHPGGTLCIVHPPGQRFAAIEDAAAATGLPITRISRDLSPQVRQSAELGFFNGHVPVTAVITAAALVAAVLGGHDAVVLSNEWSASSPTLIDGGQAINHQWSKGDVFEQDFEALVARRLGPQVSVFSYLRARSELWVAQQFARLTPFHLVFRSCNRSFAQNPAERLDHWCARCDKCCFIDLILAPFMAPGTLSAIFGGLEPMTLEENAHRFRTLVGLEPDAKPFECVGDVGECRAALLLAAERADRQHTPLLQSLRDEVSAGTTVSTDPSPLLAPIGPHYIPERYAPPDLLVRTR